MLTRFEANLAEAPRVPFQLAVADWKAFRAERGHKPNAVPLLTPPSGNAKLSKSQIATYGLSLSPADEAGLPGANLCPFAGDCKSGCLANTGRAAMHSSQYARQTRTMFAWLYPGSFLALLRRELLDAADKHDGIAVRLNVFSDVQWERVPLIREYIDIDMGIRFYDYTKFSPSVRPSMLGYDLTRSASEKTDWGTLLAWLESGERVAMVFRETPATYRGVRVVDGDLSDERFLDPRPALVGLRAKGRARTMTSEFVVVSHDNLT